MTNVLFSERLSNVSLSNEDAASEKILLPADDQDSIPILQEQKQPQPVGAATGTGATTATSIPYFSIT